MSEEPGCDRCATRQASWSQLFGTLCDLCLKAVTEAELRFPGQGLQVAGAVRKPRGGLTLR